ncbi:uncharacterized protein LOC143914976 [Arctopsyche grandis]|uniref:uncharacterized protein LOC143914976 n=1 Tax=Arctopsyche grandis TaxID=121162 RepID=UPI00406D88A0
MTLLMKCCHCFELRAGILFIGWLDLVCAIIQYIFSISFFFYMSHQSDSKVPNRELAIHMGSLIFVSIVAILINLALIYGTYKSVKSLLIPWLLIVGLFILLTVAVALYLGIKLLYTDKMIEYGGLIILFGLSIAGVNLYCWLCVLSLYQKIKNEKRSKPEKRLSCVPDNFISPPKYNDEDEL